MSKKTMLEILEEYFESDQYYKDIEENKKKEKIRQERFNKLEKFFNNNSFDMFIVRMISEHDDKWIDKCYNNGCEPYPNNKLGFFFDYLGEMFEPIENNISQMNCPFANILYKFKNYYFQFVFGQGTITRIYNDKYELLLQI